MRLLIVTPMLPHPAATSAGALVMHGQLLAAAERHAVTLATFAGPDLADREALAGLRASGIEVSHVWRSAPVGLARWRRRARLALGWLRGDRPLRALEFAEGRMQALLMQLLHERPFDLLQVEDNAMGGYAYPEAVTVPALLTEHDAALIAGAPAGAGRVRNLLAGAERRRWRRYGPAVWSRFARLQVFTPGDAAVITAASPDLADRVRVNPFGIAIPPPADPSQEEADTVLFVGGFAHPPNVDATLWLGDVIMPMVRASRPGARLTIVGDQPPEAVRALAARHPYVTVTGRVPAIDPYLERAAIVLAPLRMGGGMRLKVLQAMARGKAVVTTPLGAAGLEVEGCLPPLALAGDAAGLAGAAVALLCNAGKRRALGREAREFVTRHRSWSAYASRQEAVYRELRSSGRGTDGAPDRHAKATGQLDASSDLALAGDAPDTAAMAPAVIDRRLNASKEGRG